jgi:hypothetical protein
MQPINSGKIQNKLIDSLDRAEKRQNHEQGRIFRFKLHDIHNKLVQTLLMKHTIETEKPSVVSDSILAGLKKALKSTDFDFKYFISPIRNLVSHPNPVSLYLTQYVLEVLIDNPDIIEVYGTNEEIYNEINNVIVQAYKDFERAERDVLAQLTNNKKLVSGSNEYEMEYNQLLQKKLGEPQML